MYQHAHSDSPQQSAALPLQLRYHVEYYLSELNFFSFLLLLLLTSPSDIPHCVCWPAGSIVSNSVPR